MKRFKRALMIIFGALGAFVLSIITFNNNKVVASTNEISKKNQNTITDISDLQKIIDNNINEYFNSDLVYALPSELEDDDLISVIVSLDQESLYDSYEKLDTNKSISDYISSASGANKADKINTAIEQSLNKLSKAKFKYSVGETYDTLLAGFEVEIKAKDFEKLSNLFPNSTLILGDVYEQLETEVVTNDVNVYDTGIFDSSNCEYQGDGVVVAVLDTGLDYTHTAFSVDNFTTSKEAFTLDYVKARVSSTQASTFTSGLTAEDVYVNRKVPYAYDYADKDSDVAPINSEHGTHVAGIIAGRDSTITGVAPNAQLAIFKVFSDHSDGAKTSWLIAALEDCVVMGVDVINMSLGSGCGFTREVDKENVNKIYDKVKDSGIGLIASAANSYNATMGSKKNGNNGLTSNPDSGTVGSPSTYDAALSIASVEGVKTSYLSVADSIIYFTEASTNSADVKKSFVDDILATVDGKPDEHTFDYVQIPGIGRSSDYPEEDSYYAGKIVLVKRGTTTFEDKVRVALIEKGAAGIIIYNNVSGTISMSVGANIGAVCSLSQDDGEYLISKIDPETKIGKLTIKRSNLAGPFMSDFSSWGPTSDLKIKPEITAHGGQILSAVPGQGYERLSGTSMAAPNLTGAAALIYQYIKYSGVFGTNLTSNDVTAIANQLMMSTADIIYDKNGLPSSVRKQGAGLISIDKATSAEAYISTYDNKGQKMDKAKLELGDDKTKTGTYTMSFEINNLVSKEIKYKVSSIVLTEGVSTTYTSHGETTVTQQSYALDKSYISSLAINGTLVDKATDYYVTVRPNGKAVVTLTLQLDDTAKKYLDESFENGMYVEGFITLIAQDETKVNLSVPYLAFYGDWTQAPIFDEEYYDTNADEINAGIDEEDKLMEDAYATRVIGGLYSDYISTLGTYYFVQDPKATQIAASKDKIAVSNQNKGESGSTISSIRSVNAGLLRNAKIIYVTIYEESTGEVIYTKEVTNQHKSFSSGSTIYASSIDIEYNILENELKNNTRYICTLEAYIDYEGVQNNARNTFTFPFYVDFEAPIVTDVIYRTETDRSTQKTSLYADLYIYDNHYAMGAQVGQIVRAPEGSEYTFSLKTFGKYVTPVYSEYNSTTVVTVNLTDYIEDIKNSVSIKYNTDGSSEVLDHTNTFIVNVYDYAMNSATYEIALPDDVKSMYFENADLKLSPNETLDLTKALKIYPSSTWIQTLSFESSNENIAAVVNNVLVAKESGTATIKAIGYTADGEKIETSMAVKVLSADEEGYVNYSVPEINKFEITGYKTIKAYYDVSSDKREIGITDGEYDFGDTISLSMYPSESVTLKYVLDSYFPEDTEVVFKTSNSKIATVTEDGTIVAQQKGNTTIMANVLYNGKTTLYSAKVAIKVKEPFDIMSIYLQSYRGLGGEVIIPDDRGITTINDYAFSNYKYVDKDLSAGDVIDEEDPYYIKQMYIGEDTITKIVIPEGVTTINKYAFANLTALEEVVLPSTLTKIGVGAFYGCTSLKTINLEHVKFINEKAFALCPLEELDFSSTVSIGTYAFQNCMLAEVVLPSCAQSLSEGAFADNEYLASVQFKAKKMKIAPSVFKNCIRLTAVNINASVISAYAFAGCSDLTDVTLGADVAVIGEYAFSGTNVSQFKVNSKNPYLTLEADGALVLKDDELVLVAPNYSGENNTFTSTALKIGNGAFAGNKKIFNLVLNNVVEIGDYAFAGCTNLKTVTMPNVEVIGKYAFTSTDLKTIGNLEKLQEVKEYAFAITSLETLTIANDAVIDSYAFAYNVYLTEITLGNNVVVDSFAFYTPIKDYTYDSTSEFTHYESYTYNVLDEANNIVQVNNYYRYKFEDGLNSALLTVTVGDNCNIGLGAFYGHGKLQTVNLGTGAVIGARAFYNCKSLENIDLTKAKEIDDQAFAGLRTRDFYLNNNVWQYAYEGSYVNGELVRTAAVYSCFAPKIQEVDLTNVETLGEGVFAGNQYLTTVTLPSNMKLIGSYMFANCSKLETIELNNIEGIGPYAFFASGIKNINLSKVKVISDAAFYNTKLEEVEFADGICLGDYAFAYANDLYSIKNDKNISIIGAYAFANTAISIIDLENTISIGDYAFEDSALLYVSFGKDLVDLGENPFAGCDIVTFGIVSDVEFNGVVVDKNVVESYKLNNIVLVSDGVLYKATAKGLILVSYPASKNADSYTILSDTVRISAYAFAYSNIKNVTLSEKLKAIGDKAFYGCKNLSTVTFRSYDAPLLEEEYSEDYANPNNLAMTGNLSTYKGLAISKYYMWNASSDYTNYYYGANFKSYIGHIDNKIIMVKPKNGNNYDSFIFNQYFDTLIDGNLAPTAETLSVIELIDSLPSNITLKDEALVAYVRSAYEKIALLEQKSLVTNLDTLVKAESTLEYLKAQNQGNVEPDTPDTPTEENGFAKFMSNNAVGLTIALIIFVASTAVIVLLVVSLNKKNNKGEVKNNESSNEVSNEETKEEVKEDVNETKENESEEEKALDENENKEDDLNE